MLPTSAISEQSTGLSYNRDLSIEGHESDFGTKIPEFCNRPI